MHSQLRNGGYAYTFRWDDNLGHQPNPHPLVAPDAWRWLDRKHHPSVKLAPDEQAFLAKVTAADLDNPQTWEELIRIGGVPAGTVAVKAAASKNPETRLAFAQAAGKVMFEEPSFVPLAKLTADTDPRVAAAAFAALTDLANWRRQPAQATLISIARDAKRPKADRIAACNGLGACMFLPLLGNVEDVPLAETLVELMGDADDDVRAAAWKPLSAVAADGRGYAPGQDAKARQAPLQAWRAWIEQLKAKVKAI
jgi:hypothetical protein